MTTLQRRAVNLFPKPNPHRRRIVALLFFIIATPVPLLSRVATSFIFFRHSAAKTLDGAVEAFTVVSTKRAVPSCHTYAHSALSKTGLLRDQRGNLALVSLDLHTTQRRMAPRLQAKKAASSTSKKSETEDAPAKKTGRPKGSKKLAIDDEAERAVAESPRKSTKRKSPVKKKAAKSTISENEVNSAPLAKKKRAKKAPAHQVVTERDELPKLWDETQATANGSYS